MKGDVVNYIDRILVWSEHNLEKYAHFFFPPKGTNVDAQRKYDIEVDLPDGTKEFRAILVQPASTYIEDLLGKPKPEGKEGTLLGAFTTSTYDVYLALIRIWERNGKTSGEFNISITDIVKEMGVKNYGDLSLEIVLDLFRLALTNMSFVQSAKFERDNMSVKHLRVLEFFEYDTLSQRKIEGDEYKGQFDKTLRIKFDSRISANLLNLNVIPVNWKERKQIRSPIAKSLYNRIDNILTKDTKPYSRTARNLVVDLNLDEHKYKYLSQRKALCIGLKKQLSGRLTSKMSAINVVAEITAKGDDWKCTFTAKKQLSHKKTLKIVNEGEELDTLVEMMEKAVYGENSNDKLYKRFAKHYSFNLIYRACSEFKDTTKGTNGIDSAGAYFTSIIHRLSHEMGFGWIKVCKLNEKGECQYNKKEV
jgi:hypothetical protein